MIAHACAKDGLYLPLRIPARRVGYPSVAVSMGWGVGGRLSVITQSNPQRAEGWYTNWAGGRAILVSHPPF